MKLTNIHQSKGLEYEVLFVAGLNKDLKRQGSSSIISYKPESGLLLNTKFDNHSQKDDLLNIHNVFRFYQKEANFNEAIKEELRLLYVALTRDKRALFLITSPSDNLDNPKSYSDFLYAKGFDNYVIDTFGAKHIHTYKMKQTKDEYSSKIKDKKWYYPEAIDTLVEKTLDIKTEIIETKKASKKINQWMTDDFKNNLKRGTKLHEMFEYADFKKLKQSKNPYLRKLGNTSFDGKYLEDATHIFVEYDFYDKDKKLNGTIDLLAIYPDVIHIIDYKTRNIDDDGYDLQLNNYLNYVSSIYKDTTVNTFIYSIVDNKTRKIK